MWYSKVVNLPSANTAYLMRTLLLALDPNFPEALANALVKPVKTNSGTVAIGDASMTSVDDGNALDVGESSDEATGTPGLVLHTSAEYLIGSAVNQKVLIQGQTF